MCGRTINDDGVKPQTDHKISQTWGGPRTTQNPWAIGEECSRGKCNFFASFNPAAIQQVARIESVHECIAFFLKLHAAEPVTARAIEFAANVRDQWPDWRTRLRGLRYHPIGLEIDVSKTLGQKGTQSYYALKNWRGLPKDQPRNTSERRTAASSPPPLADAQSVPLRFSQPLHGRQAVGKRCLPVGRRQFFVQ